MRCTKMIAEPKERGKPRQVKQCEGTIEANTKVYLDIIDATLDGDSLVINDIEPSHVNDVVKGHHFGLEEMEVSCDSCGAEYDWTITDALRGQTGLQPIGNAERTLGKRGGINNDEEGN